MVLSSKTLLKTETQIIQFKTYVFINYLHINTNMFVYYLTI